MPFEQKPNTGALFNNAERKTEDTHPDYAGNIKVACPSCQAQQDYWLNGWVKLASTGKKYFSLSVKPKQAR